MNNNRCPAPSPLDFATVARAERDALGAAQEPLSALCLSGGGIRSATFCLGVLRGFAKHGLVGNFHYVSSVSGGGYLACALARWLAAKGTAPNAGTIDEALTSVEFESRLRARGRFLAPRWVLFSVDSWTLAATYLRNLLEAWLLLMPMPLLAICLSWSLLMLTGHLVALGNCGLPAGCSNSQSLYTLLLAGVVLVGAAVVRWLGSLSKDESSKLQPAIVGHIAAVLVTCLVVAGTSILEPKPIRLFVYEWLSRLVPAWFIALAVCALAFGALAFFAYRELCRGQPASSSSLGSRAGAVGFALLTLAWFAALTVVTRSEPVAGQGLESMDFGRLALVLALGPAGLILCWGIGRMVQLSLTQAETDLAAEIREARARSAAAMLIVCAVWIVGFATTTLVPWTVLVQLDSGELTLSAIVGSVATLASVAIGFSSTTPANRDAARSTAAQEGSLGRFTKYLPLDAIAYAALWYLFAAAGILFFVLLYKGRHWDYDTFRFPPDSGWAQTVVVIGFVFAVLVGWRGRHVNPNRFALHGMYKTRLTRAFLRSAVSCANPEATTVQPDVPLSDLSISRPFFVINAAMNVSGSGDLQTRNRQALPFTLSMLHYGSSALPTRRDGEPASGRYRCHRADENLIGLGTAMTISGAAVNPNMGYHSKPGVAALLTVFNVRLGWWMPNPEPPQTDQPKDAIGRLRQELFSSTQENQIPRNPIGRLWQELFSSTHEKQDFVNVSDGGHFENLGIYEMIRRGCKYIVAVDASQDGDARFDSLANAIRKVRVDLGVAIKPLDGTFVDIYSRESQSIGRYFACFEVDYLNSRGCEVRYKGLPGVLLYIKPAMYGNEPLDVLEYGAASPDFPHETTADQFFDEQQFEAYRELGRFISSDVLLSGAALSAAGLQRGSPLSVSQLMAVAAMHVKP
jgi:hypothetical protein